MALDWKAITDLFTNPTVVAAIISIIFSTSIALLNEKRNNKREKRLQLEGKFYRHSIAK